MIRKSYKKLVLKILVGSLISVLAIVATTMIVFLLSGIGNDLQVAATLGAGIVSAIVAFWVMLLWGLPVHFFLLWLERQEFFWYAIAALIPGPIFIFFVKPFGEDELKYLLSQSVLCSAIGVIGALAFWLYVVRRERIKSV